jgi:type IV pilus assembly protein PilC
MPVYRYIARTRAGARIEGELTAADRRAAARQVERMDAVPVSMTEAAAADPRARRKRAAGGGFRLRRGPRAPRMNVRERLLFTREVSDLLASGMTLGDALHALGHRGEGRERAADRIIGGMREGILQGQSLSEALAAHPDTFPALYVSAVRAGEAAGTLTDTLQRLAEHYERAQETREKITTALTYPCIVLGFGVLMMILLSTFVIPRFAAIFADFGGTLPLPTRILMTMSRWMTGLRGLALLGLLAAAVVAASRHLATDAGRLWWHRRQLRLPVVRHMITANAYAQFARTLGSLLFNGVPVLQALSIVEDTVGNQVLAAEVRAARERVTDGSTISGPLAAGGVFPRILTDMLAVGERTGDLPGALGHIARRYESERDRAMRMFLTILEPVMILLIALVVGFVAISMLLAVFDMTSGLAR